MVKNREGSLKFFLFSGRKSIYQVKNGKRSLNIFREVGGRNSGFPGGREAFLAGSISVLFNYIHPFLNNFFVWNARLERASDGGRNKEGWYGKF